MKFFASCGKGLEYLLADELRGAWLRASATATMAGANAEGELVDAQRAVLWSRLASRVLWPLADFECADEACPVRRCDGGRLGTSMSRRA